MGLKHRSHPHASQTTAVLLATNSNAQACSQHNILVLIFAGWGLINSSPSGQKHEYNLYALQNGSTHRPPSLKDGKDNRVIAQVATLVSTECKEVDKTELQYITSWNQGFLKASENV